MIKIIAKQDFRLNNTDYIVGDEIKLDNMEKIIKLNERGFIEPLSHKDLVILDRELKEKEKL